VLDAVAQCMDAFRSKGYDVTDIKACGISNQRETFLLWDENGIPLYNAVVWQCKRSVQICERLKKEGLEEMVKEKTGLLIDPYFSATKIIWLNENVKRVRSAIKEGKAFFGTVDTWLLYRFTNGKVYATDYTNASRTLLFNLATLQWDEELIGAFGLKGLHFPELRPSSFHYGATAPGSLLPFSLPITALIGDSHAAAFGEGCFEAGMAKATLGTGCSILMNIGPKPVRSANGMVTTICWSTEERVDYALEGVIVSCGSTLEWLKNECALIDGVKETEQIARSVPDNGGVYLVPAFSGLGSPYWQMERRAAISGISFSTTKNHIVRAALESIPFQIMDVLSAMQKDTGLPLKELMANGGITANRFVMQFLADLLQTNIRSNSMQDVSALGAGLLAGLKAGVFENIEALKNLQPDKKVYSPSANASSVEKAYAGWQKEISNY
jgi:glycerol kinase